MSSRGRWCGPVITRTSRRTLLPDRASLVLSRFTLYSIRHPFSNCHPERNICLAKRNTYGVEGPLKYHPINFSEFSPGDGRRSENFLTRGQECPIHTGPA